MPISGLPVRPNEVAWMEQALGCLRDTGLTESEKASVILLISGYVRNEASTNADIAEAFGVTTRSPESWRKRAVLDGPMALLQRKPRATAAVAKLGGENEARLTALACSRPPRGLARWSLRLLAERLVELEVVEAVSHETVRRSLKKAN